MKTVRVSFESLREAVAAVFVHLGESSDGANEAAEVLAGADLRGIDIEGVSLLPLTVDAYKAGALKPRAQWKIVREAAATATVDADRGLVCVLGRTLMQLAIEKARNVGIGFVTMYNGGDAGSLGHYAARAMAEGMVGIAASAQGLRMAPVFGAQARLGTNPIAIAVPAKTEAPLIFDAATTASALGTLRSAYRDGAPFPPGVIAELDGTPIMTETPPRPVGQFLLLPLGGDRLHGAQKGFGFGLMVEVLTTMLTGTLPSMLDPDAGTRCCFAALDIAAFTDLDLFLHNMDKMLWTLRSTKPMPGQTAVSYPGFRRQEEAQRRGMQGIPLRGDTVKWFADASSQMGVPPLAPI